MSASFIATPTDQLGVPGLFAASEVTPEGGIYTGFAELDFELGAPLQPYAQPRRRLAEGGRYPIIASQVVRRGVRYTVTLLAAVVDGVGVDVVRVTTRNLTRTARRAVWAVGLRQTGDARANRLGAPYFRYLAPAGSLNGLYSQPGEAWAPGRRYAVTAGAIVRGATAVVVVPAGPGRTDRVAGRCEQRTQICAQVTYGRVLAPGTSATLEFKLPAVPVADPSPALADIARLDFPAARRALRQSFDATLGAGMRLALPEPAVENAYYASLVEILTSRYQLPSGAWVQAVNDLQYHAFWLRDAAIMANALDLDGLAGPAAEDLGYFGAWQQPDGLFISRPGQYDGMGEALWALGRHAELTGDAAFAARMLPSVARAVDWIAGLPLGLMPASDPGDNEYVAGRLAGDDFWAVAGLDAAARLAAIAGRPDLVASWEPVASRFRSSVAAATRSAAARDGGAVPPALDRSGGRDWGNWWVAYPDGPLAPSDPTVTATIRAARAGFREGIATYAGMLHDYTGFRIFETELARGEQAAVVGGLYAELAHETGTLGGFETDIRPGANRSSAANLTPHGTYAAELVTLVRNMLVRDGDAGRVALLGAVPGDWLRPGREISVGGAPTAHGRVSFTLRSRTGGAVLSWSAPAGTQLVWPLPASVEGFRATAGRVAGDVLALPAASGSLAVRWRLRPGGPTLEAARARLVAEYGGG